MPITKRISPKVGNMIEVLLSGKQEWSIGTVIGLKADGFWIWIKNTAPSVALFYAFTEETWRWPHRTLRELAQEVLDVQDACNLSGIVHSFDRAMTNLRTALPDAGTDELNHHPIVRAWISKLVDLSCHDHDIQDRLWSEIDILAKGETP